MVATIPGAIAGLLFERAADRMFRAPVLIATTLIVMGILLWLVDRANLAVRTLRDLQWRDAALIGVAQVFGTLSRWRFQVGATRHRGARAGL